MTLVRRYDCPARRSSRASPAAAYFNALRLMPPTLFVFVFARHNYCGIFSRRVCEGGPTVTSTCFLVCMLSYLERVNMFADRTKKSCSLARHHLAALR